MIQTTPQIPQDLCLEALEILKELKELTNTTFQKAPSFSCVYCGGPHDDYQCRPYYEPDQCSSFNTSSVDKTLPPQFPIIQNSRDKAIAELLAEKRAARNRKSMEELLVKERAAKTRVIFRNAALFDYDDDSDDEDIFYRLISLLQFHG
jgi:hypothetical protein